MLIWRSHAASVDITGPARCYIDWTCSTGRKQPVAVYTRILVDYATAAAAAAADYAGVKSDVSHRGTRNLDDDEDKLTLTLDLLIELYLCGTANKDQAYANVAKKKKLKNEPSTNTAATIHGLDLHQAAMLSN